MIYKHGDLTRLELPDHNDPWVEVRIPTKNNTLVIIDLNDKSPNIVTSGDVRIFKGALTDKDVGKRFWTTNISGKFLFPFVMRNGKMIHF